MPSAWDDRFEKLLRGHMPFLSPGTEMTADLRLRDHGLDSLGIIDLLVSLEETYGVRLRDDALTLETFETPQTLWNTLSIQPDAAL
jgi:acyl carrier protein